MKKKKMKKKRESGKKNFDEKSKFKKSNQRESIHVDNSHQCRVDRYFWCKTLYRTNTEILTKIFLYKGKTGF
jgi:hypothetical protein